MSGEFKEGDRIIYNEPGYWNPANKTMVRTLFLACRGKMSARIKYWDEEKTVRLDSIKLDTQKPKN